MTTWLKQSTAADVELGPFVDSVDGVTPETGLTVSQADCQLIKNGGSAAQKNDATSATHLAGGHYKVPLNSTDTGTLGRLRLYVNEGGAVPVWRDFMVVPANVWDSFFGADRLQVHVDEMTAGIITSSVIATDAIGSDELASSAVTEIQSGLASSSALTTLSGLVDDLEGRLTAARAGYLDNLSGGAVALASALATVAGYVDTEVAAILAAVDTEVAGIKAKTDNLPASPAAVGSAMTLADGAVTEAKFSSGGLNAIADAILKRDWTAVSGEASRSVLNALRFLRNKWTAIGATLTVSKEDDSTTAWSAVITKDAASDPITGSDPV